MPAMYQSVLVAGARDRNARFVGSRFHQKHQVPAMPPGQVGGDYLDAIGGILRALIEEETEAIDQVGAVCAQVLNDGGVIHAGMISHFPVYQHGAPGDPLYMRRLARLDGESPSVAELERELQLGDLFFFLGYYRRPTQAYQVARRAGARIVEVITGDGSDGSPQPDYVIRPKWPFGDAVTRVPGYDVEILPSSGIVQAAIYWAVVASIWQASRRAEPHLLVFCEVEMMNSVETTVQLRSGEKLMIEVCEPPFPGGEHSLCWWGDIAADLMAGNLRPWLYTPYYLGKIDGELVGYMGCQTPADTREVGLVEFVWTAEEHRRKGIASLLLGRLVEEFTQAGGLALYLCTANPHAGSLYERHGFRYFVGDGMRYLAPGAGDFEPRLPRWRQSGRGSRRYLGRPAGGLGALQSSRAEVDREGLPEPEFPRYTRYESHFVKTLRRLEGQRGFCLALENAKRRLVGLAMVERRGTFAEQHTGILSFRVAPAFSGQAADLLGATVERCAALEIAVLHVYLADCDDDQKQLLEEAGFGEEARFKRRLRVDGRFVDMVVYARTIAQTAAALFDEGYYYGGRKDWQRERAGGTD